jgi:hypothetical protein
MNFNITTNSLDQCIATFQHGDYQTIERLLLYVKGDGTNDIIPTFNQATYATTIALGNGGRNGDAFNQIYYFMRAGCDLATSLWSINSTNGDPYPLPPSKKFNNNPISLGINKIDYGSSGVHAGCLSLNHFQKILYLPYSFF